MGSDLPDMANEDLGLAPNRRVPTPQKVYNAFRESAQDYRMGFPDNEDLEPIDLDSLQV